MNKLLAIILGIAVGQGLYAEYVYDSDITTDTGEHISILNALMDNAWK